MSDRHLTADLNVRDDDGFGWTTLNETNGLGRVRTEIMLLTGSSRTMAVVRVTAADDDGWVHFSTSPGQWRRTASCLGASLRKPQPKAAAVAKPRTEPGKRLWIGAAMGDRRAPNPKVAGELIGSVATRMPERCVGIGPPTSTSLEAYMGKLIYAINTSLDGFTEDTDGFFDWSVFGEDVHEFYNDMMRGIGTQLLGRRMYETMAVWETDPSFVEESEVLADFAAAWQDSDKLVYSTTLTDPATLRTRVVSAFEAEAVRDLKQASSTDLLVGGPGLAAHALHAGLVDEIRLVLSPVALGAGKPALPTDLRLDLELIDERRFGNGAMHVAYRVRI